MERTQRGFSVSNMSTGLVNESWERTVIGDGDVADQRFDGDGEAQGVGGVALGTAQAVRVVLQIQRCGSQISSRTAASRASAVVKAWSGGVPYPTTRAGRRAAFP
jgi:hypothetical protein